MITDLSQLDLNKTYSYADYLTWQISQRLELIKGKISLMSPSPNVSHQSIEACLTAKLYNFFRQKTCRVFIAPFDVRLYDRKKSLLKNKESFTVVQPDLSVICNPELLDTQGCNGAPDWIIEILSKGNSKHDMKTKYALYEESGVKEYWIVSPYQKTVLQFVLNDLEKYQLHAMYADDDIVVPYLFPDLQIDLTEVFDLI